MTWRAMWDIDHWPGHDYRDCATERDAVVVAESVVATTGREVTVFEIEGGGVTEKQSAENDAPFAHDDEGNLIAVRCRKCGTVVAVGYDHECVIPPGSSERGEDHA